MLQLQIYTSVIFKWKFYFNISYEVDYRQLGAVFCLRDCVEIS